jgi:D-alanyl-D-alanine carboxypeptidase (penicillin-binding protein 5/6)
MPNLEKRVEVSETLPAPLKRGQKLGEAVCSLNGQELGRVSLVAGKDVPRAGWHRQLWDKVFN